MRKCQLFPEAQNNSFSNLDLDVYSLQLLKQNYDSNPLISYLNINSLSRKIDALRQICKTASPEILCINKTKLDSSFPDSQFRIDGYISPLIGETEIIMEGAKWFL